MSQAVSPGSRLPGCPPAAVRQLPRPPWRVMMSCLFLIPLETYQQQLLGNLMMLALLGPLGKPLGGLLGRLGARLGRPWRAVGRFGTLPEPPRRPWLDFGASGGRSWPLQASILGLPGIDFSPSGKRFGLQATCERTNERINQPTHPPAHQPINQKNK